MINFKEKDFYKLDKFIKDLNLNLNLITFLEDDDSGEYLKDSFWHHLDRVTKKWKTKVKIEWGYTKLVLIPDCFPFVIKIPMPWRQEGAVEEDYLKDEEVFYSEMDKRGFASFFTETVYYCNYKGLKYYLQEKVTKLAADALGDVSHSSIESLNYADKNHSVFEREWIAAAYDIYGEKAISSFIEFLKKSRHFGNDYLDGVDRMCNDMHCYNYGYINDYPVIFDYSGCE